ncbi:MAG: transporter [Bacteroidota bacterium]
MKKMILLLLLFTSGQVMYAQGPWAKGKGHGYSQLVFTGLPQYAEIFDGGFRDFRDLEREIFEVVIASYTEVGITDKLTLGATIPLVIVGTGDPTEDSITPTLPEDSKTALGNVTLLGKYTLLDKSVKVAFITAVDFPTSSRDEVSGLSTGVDAYTFQPKFSVGGSNSKWFYYGFLGYGIRTNDHHDFLSLGVEGGIKTSEKLSLILNIHRLQNLDNGDPLVDSPANIQTGLYTSFQEYTGVLVKLFADDLYQGFGGFLSLGGGFAATSVAATPAISLGVFRKW